MRDRLGILFSGLCLCHCALTPLLILLLGSSTLLGVVESEWTHKILLLPVFILAIFSLPMAWLKTHNLWILIFSILGISLIITAQFFHGTNEVLLTVLGSMSLVIAHLANIKLRQRN